MVLTSGLNRSLSPILVVLDRLQPFGNNNGKLNNLGMIGMNQVSKPTPTMSGGFYTIAEKFGKGMIVRGVDGNGTHFSQKVKWNPSLFLLDNENQNTGWKTLDGRPVVEKIFDNPTECWDFYEQSKFDNNGGVFGQTNFSMQYLNDQYPGELDWDIDKIRIYTIDIETSVDGGFPNPQEAQEKVLLISIKDSFTKRIVTLGLHPYENNDKNVNYYHCSSEEDLLSAFVKFWSENPPDIITGWNADFFDIPYLVNRITRLLGEEMANKLSPFKWVKERDEYVNNRKMKKNKIYGISQLDYLSLYKKHMYVKKESYKLDFIAEDELGERKLTNPFATFKEFYEKDWQRFVEYNIRDVELVDRLEEKLSLIEIHLTLAYEAKVNYEDVFNQTRVWDNIVHNYLVDKQITIPQREDGLMKNKQYEGAYVKEPPTGLHEWVCSFDATSLYPSIMLALNISPEKLVGVDSDTNFDNFLRGDIAPNEEFCIAPSGAKFKRDEIGLIPEIIQKFMDKRTIAKTKMLEAEKIIEEIKSGRSQESLDKYEKIKASFHNKQMAIKIAMNSLYGALGTEYFRFYNVEIARAITLTGQYIIRYMERRLNYELNNMFGTDTYDYCFYLDTDSVYIRLGDVIKNFMPDETDKKVIASVMDKLCKEKIQPHIDTISNEIHKQLNTLQDKIIFKQEVIADRGIWVAKKKYILKVFSSEGVVYDKPKNKIMGLEMVKSSTPQKVRDKLKDAVDIILEADENTIKNYISDFRKEFFAFSVEDMAFPRGVNQISKYKIGIDGWDKGTPINSRGAIVYNGLVATMGLDKKYELIREGDKIKYIYLTEPNSIGTNVIAFLTELPKEFELHEYVDKKTQFEKLFSDPIQNIIEKMGMTTKENGSASFSMFDI